jgi:hypothetical protein
MYTVRQAGRRAHTHFKDIAFQNGAIGLDRVVKKKKEECT